MSTDKQDAGNPEAGNPIDQAIDTSDKLTLDRALLQHPDSFSEADWTEIVAALRRDRARFIKAEADKVAAQEDPSNE
jgi:hypothetical protein